MQLPCRRARLLRWFALRCLAVSHLLCLLRPTSPLRRPEDVVLDAIKKKDKVSKRGAFSWRACGRVKYARVGQFLIFRGLGRVSGVGACLGWRVCSVALMWWRLFKLGCAVAVGDGAGDDG